MLSKMSEQIPLAPAEAQGAYVIYQCKSCMDPPKVLRDNLVPKELVCVKCGGHVLGKVKEPGLPRNKR